MTRIALFTSSSLRHKAFSTIVSQKCLDRVFLTLHEEEDPLSNYVHSLSSDLSPPLLEHLHERHQAEKDFFHPFLEFSSSGSPSHSVPRGWLSSPDCIALLREYSITHIAVYGTSILRGSIIELYKHNIINLHLGLSPYYRGSGTNYFPFVNSTPEYAGATFMYLDAGVDTGSIIHQIRPTILPHDSFHQLSNRFLLKCFYTYASLLPLFLQRIPSAPSPSTSNTTRLVYKKSDFTAKSLSLLHDNFRNNLLQNYLKSRTQLESSVPIVVHPSVTPS